MSNDKNAGIDSINLSPLNTSKSKAMYSFGKSTRFPGLKEAKYFSIKCSSSFYQKPSTLDKRATSFGFGTKSELISRYHYSPSPDKYPKNSDFQVSPKKGISIGLGRQDCKNVSIFNMTKYPAPTDYSAQNKENSAGYSMRSKVKLPVLFPENKTPGPGQYVSEHIDKNGASFLSKYKSNICFKIHEQSPTKISKPQAPVLGPETYNTIMSASGKQVLAKHKTEKSFYFDKKPRETFYVQKKGPGPGAYGAFSEFNR